MAPPPLSTPPTAALADADATAAACSDARGDARATEQPGGHADTPENPLEEILEETPGRSRRLSRSDLPRSVPPTSPQAPRRSAVAARWTSQHAGRPNLRRQHGRGRAAGTATMTEPDRARPPGPTPAAAADPALDFFSPLFDPERALATPGLQPPRPNVRPLNNLNECRRFLIEGQRPRPPAPPKPPPAPPPKPDAESAAARPEAVPPVDAADQGNAPAAAPVTGKRQRADLVTLGPDGYLKQIAGTPASRLASQLATRSRL